MVLMLQRKNKEQEETIKQLRRQCDEQKKGESGAEAKIKALNDMNSEKTKALIRSINLLKKEIQKIKFESKDNVRHKMNEKLQEDIKLQDFAINALRKLIQDEDKCNLAIKRELEKGPLRVRVLSREELKIEVKKYKNISLKCIKEMQRLGGKTPGYATTIIKEFESGTGVEGVKQMKGSDMSQSNNDFEGESMFEEQSEMPDEVPEKIMQKLEKQEDQIVKINMELKVKNEKILELLSELEEIKIQVFARDKSIEL